MTENYVLHCAELIKFLLETVTLASSAIVTGSNKAFVVGGRSFTYVMKSKGHRTDPWGTPYFIVPQFKRVMLRLMKLAHTRYV
jgi:hypothetical protein